MQALLAVLAFSGPSGASRQELGKILWPELGSDARSNNLRQTLLRAKRILGETSIDSSRTHCGFAAGFSWSSDLDAIDDSFMAGFEGEWFARVRGSRARRLTQTITESFLNLLEWLSQTDPERTIGLMRENLGITIGLSVQDLERVLARVGDAKLLPGWYQFFKAGLRTAGYVTAEREFRDVLAIAEKSGDFLLGVQTAAQLVICLVMQGRLAEAHAMGQACEALAIRSGDPALRPTATQIRAIALLHDGQLNEGLALLERAEGAYALTMDAVVMRTLRAHYLANYGRPAEADRLLELPRKYLAETGHGLVEVTTALANAKLNANAIDPGLAIEEHQKVLALTESTFNEWHTVIANEELAMAYLKIGEVPLAKQRAIQARKVRRTMSMGYTPLDRVRLSRRG